MTRNETCIQYDSNIDLKIENNLSMGDYLAMESELGSWKSWNTY